MITEETTAAPAPPQAPTPVGGRPRRELVLAVLLPLLVVLAAGVVRFHRLDEPARCYFDETYYYYDARDYLERGVERGFAVHPPVGKWLIATGLVLFGLDDDHPLEQAVVTEPDGCVVGDDEPENPPARAREAAEAFARRAVVAFAGTAAVGVTYLIGRRLFRRRSVAALGALLLAFDGLALTMSRISMLDIFVQLFVVLGVWALLVDRDRLWAGAPPPGAVPEPGARPPHRPRTWRWVAGVCFGLGVATKWSALLPLGFAGLFLLLSEALWRRRWTGRWTTGYATAVAGAFLSLLVVPIVVYVASYAGWFANFEHTRKADRCAGQACESVAATVDAIAGGWWEEQGEIFRFHRDLEADHPYRAPAITWAALGRPVAYYYESCNADDDPADCVVEEGNIAEVLGIGNPAIWWMALVGYPFLIGLAWQRRDWAAWTIIAFLFGQALPYLASPRPVFLFYMTPAVPFIALSLAYLAERALERPGTRWVPAAIAVLAVAGLLFWFPLFTAIEIPRSAWDARIWIRPGWI